MIQRWCVIVGRDLAPVPGDRSQPLPDTRDRHEICSASSCPAWCGTKIGVPVPTLPQRAPQPGRDCWTIPPRPHCIYTCFHRWHGRMITLAVRHHGATRPRFHLLPAAASGETSALVRSSGSAGRGGAESRLCVGRSVKLDIYIDAPREGFITLSGPIPSRVYPT